MSIYRFVLVLLIASCSAPAKHPTVVIVESRSFDDQTARGEARVLQTPSPHVRLAGARAWLAIAEALVTTPAASYQAATRGLSELGPDYAARHVRDDTTLKEDAAKDDFARGDNEAAAATMTQILRSRIKMYTRRYETEVE